MIRILTTLFALSTAVLAADFTPIFDGKTLDGWDGDPKFWSIQDGAITGITTKENPTKGNTFCIWRGAPIDDFELKLEFKIVGGNSGIQYRSFRKPGTDKWRIGGYQADFDAGNNWAGTNYGEAFRGILAKRGEKVTIGKDGKKTKTGSVGDAKELASHIKDGEWNEYHIIAKGYYLVQKINGVVMSEVIDEHEGTRRRDGLLALQLHAGPPMNVQFKNIRLKRLPLADGKKKVLFLGGRCSHGYGAHEHNAGCLLLAGKMNGHVPGVHASVYTNPKGDEATKDGFPNDPTCLDHVDSMVIYCDGGKRHMANNHLAYINQHADRGMGMAFIHYGVETVKGEPGEAFRKWIGGYFEPHWSVNPHWEAAFTTFPDHPVARGVKPFKSRDEWYYHMRFRDGMKGVTPILSAVPPAHTLSRGDGAHSGNPHVRKTAGQPQHLAWAAEREDGGRGFGFTGGHYHWNWLDDNFRKTMINAIAWTAGLDVPSQGFDTPKPTAAELFANQDYDKPDGWVSHWEGDVYPKPRAPRKPKPKKKKPAAK